MTVSAAPPPDGSRARRVGGPSDHLPSAGPRTTP